MSIDEIAVMGNGKCILQVQGVRPFLSAKYDITRHPQYKKLSDYDERNALDISKLVRCELTVRPDDVYECAEIAVPPAVK